MQVTTLDMTSINKGRMQQDQLEEYNQLLRETGPFISNDQHFKLIYLVKIYIFSQLPEGSFRLTTMSYTWRPFIERDEVSYCPTKWKAVVFI